MFNYLSTGTTLSLFSFTMMRPHNATEDQPPDTEGGCEYKSREIGDVNSLRAEHTAVDHPLSLSLWLQ
jgi:hypothetical protein